MATSTRCARRLVGRENREEGAGSAPCRGIQPLPRPLLILLLPPPPLQARDTVTSELAAVKIVKLDPGEGLCAGGRAESRAARREGRRVDISKTPPPPRGRPLEVLSLGICLAQRKEALCAHSQMRAPS